MAADDLEERLAVQIDVLVPSQPNEPDVEAPALQRVEDVVRGSCRAVREDAAAREDRQAPLREPAEEIARRRREVPGVVGAEGRWRP